MNRSRRLFRAALGGVVAAAATTSLVTPPAPATASVGRTVTNGCIAGRPEPGSTTPVDICWTMYRPGGADRTHRVPMIMHSHGWGGSRTSDPGAFEMWLDHGYGVISFDQRGFGESGGKAHIENPDLEGSDVRRLVRFVAQQPWVRRDAPGDPRIGAIGGSYGGGYQFAGAFSSLAVTGKPLFDALAPEITWNDLSHSLAPSHVVRTEWAASLSAGAVPSDALEPSVYEALVEGAATGTWPQGDGPTGVDIEAYMRRNGPAWHVSQGRRLDIPVLFGQGTTDTLFPLEQAFTNFRTALTSRAKSRSMVIGYNGGHVLPGVLPPTYTASSDPCSRRIGGGSFAQLSLRFFDEQLRSRDTGLTGYGRYHLGTTAGGCLNVGSIAADATRRTADIVSPTSAGLPLATEVAAGPIRIAGTPYLTGRVTTIGPENRVFMGLAVGTSPLDAKLVQGNVLPFRATTQLTDAPRRIALPSVAVSVPRGQHLYVLTSAVSDMFVGMGSRTPGAVTVSDPVVHLPVVGN